MPHQKGLEQFLFWDALVIYLPWYMASQTHQIIARICFSRHLPQSLFSHKRAKGLKLISHFVPNGKGDNTLSGSRLKIEIVKRLYTTKHTLYLALHSQFYHYLAYSR